MQRVESPPDVPLLPALVATNLLASSVLAIGLVHLECLPGFQILQGSPHSPVWVGPGNDGVGFGFLKIQC